MNFTRVFFILFICINLWAKPVDINFQNLEIKDFVKMVSKITNKNILLTINVPGRVNFASAKPIERKEVYDLLLSVLRSKGFTLVDTGNGYLEVVRSAEASRISPALKNSKLKQVQTEIIPINYANATTLLPKIKFLQSKYGKAIVSKKTNSLILNDHPKNLKVVRKLIKKIDTKEKKSVAFIKLEHASSPAVLPKLQKIVTSVYDQKIQSQKVSVLADEGSNTIIAVAKDRQLKMIKDYIKSLDKKDEIAEQKISILSLKNSDAESISKTLQAIISGKKYKKGETKPKITFEAETNNLIIVSSHKELEDIKEVVQKLDVDRQQVFVKAKIIEINNDKASEVGAKYGIFGGMANSSGLYSFSTSMGGSAIPFDIESIGMSLPNLQEGLALGATVSLLNTNGAADILSEPSLLCINNLESSIYVGKTESIISEGTVDASTTDVNKNTYTRQDIGLTLTIKPRISTDNKVTLDVTTILEDIVPGSTVGLPTTTKREVKTTAIVHNGESIIVGGLVKEKQDNDKTKVPLLGDLPLFGELFKYEKNNTEKVSLVVILTPYIVTKSTDLVKLREALGKLSHLENEFAKNFAKTQEEKK